MGQIQRGPATLPRITSIVCVSFRQIINHHSALGVTLFIQTSEYLTCCLSSFQRQSSYHSNISTAVNRSVLHVRDVFVFPLPLLVFAYPKSYDVPVPLRSKSAKLAMATSSILAFVRCVLFDAEFSFLSIALLYWRELPAFCLIETGQNRVLDRLFQAEETHVARTVVFVADKSFSLSITLSQSVHLWLYAIILISSCALLLRLRNCRIKSQRTCNIFGSEADWDWEVVKLSFHQPNQKIFASITHFCEGISVLSQYFASLILNRFQLPICAGKGRKMTSLSAYMSALALRFSVNKLYRKIRALLANDQNFRSE